LAKEGFGGNPQQFVSQMPDSIIQPVSSSAARRQFNKKQKISHKKLNKKKTENRKWAINKFVSSRLDFNGFCK